jgi:hypothetical protein
MDIIRTYRKGKHLNALEKYHLYKISKNNLQMNDTNIDTHNPIKKKKAATHTQHKRINPTHQQNMHQTHAYK